MLFHLITNRSSCIRCNNKIIGSCRVFCRYYSSGSDELHQLLKTMKDDGSTTKPVIGLTNFKNVKNYEKVNRPYMQVLGSGARGSSHSIYYDDLYNQRYLFNIGEGTLRTMFKVNVTDVKQIFLTHSRWKNIGGIFSFYSIIQATSSFLTIFSPYDFSSYFSNPQYLCSSNKNVTFMHLKKADKCTPFVNCVPIYSKLSDELDIHSTLTNDSEHRSSSGNCNEENKDNGLSKHSLDDLAMAYIITMPLMKKPNNTISKKHKRKLIFKRRDDIENENSSLPCNAIGNRVLSLPLCVEAGVSIGPEFDKLQNGEDVTLSNGKVVTFNEVSCSLKTKTEIIVIDAPTFGHLDYLSKCSSFDHVHDIVDIIVHFTPHEIVKSSKYKEWMRRFPTSTHHLFINEDSSCLGYKHIYKLNYQMHHICKDLFPLLDDESISDNLLSDLRPLQKVEWEGLNISNKKMQKEDTKVDERDNIFQASSLMVSLLNHKITLNKQTLDVVSPTGRDLLRLREDGDEVIHKLTKDFQTKLKELEYSTTLENKKFPQIRFLGTGAMYPGLFRNVSGILLKVSPTFNMIFDCGEGTYTQLVRGVGVDAADEILRNLNAIYISHMHPDHYLGIINILQQRHRAFQLKNPPEIMPPLQIMAPIALQQFLKDYNFIFKLPSNCYEFICLNDLLHFNEDREKLSKLLLDLDIANISTVFVKHCKDAFGVAVTLNDGCKIVYSGDTKPSEDLIILGNNCNLLIHEATFEDCYPQSSLHSSVSQAIHVGMKMNARNIILTHFSSTSNLLPCIPHHLTNYAAVAFDNMEISIYDMSKLYCLTPFLQDLFKLKYDDMMGHA